MTKRRHLAALCLLRLLQASLSSADRSGDGVKAHRSRRLRVSPALEGAGIADHVWDLAELAWLISQAVSTARSQLFKKNEGQPTVFKVVPPDFRLLAYGTGGTFYEIQGIDVRQVFAYYGEYNLGETFEPHYV